MKWAILIAVVVLAGILVNSTTLSAANPVQCNATIQGEPAPSGVACTPWVKYCGRDGYWYRCEPCGSQWCNIFKGTKCK